MKDFVFAKFWHAHTHMQDQDTSKLSTWVIIEWKSDKQAIMVDGSSDGKPEGFFQNS